METVSYTMEVPKESKELTDAVAGLLKHFVNGGDLGGAASYLPAVMTAVSGVDKVPAEMRSSGKDEAVAYLVHKVWDALEKTPAA